VNLNGRVHKLEVRELPRSLPPALLWMLAVDDGEPERPTLAQEAAIAAAVHREGLGTGVPWCGDVARTLSVLRRMAARRRADQIDYRDAIQGLAPQHATEAAEWT
jgi:hypothetical protein